MRVGLITTVGTNIGDDLIRRGVERLLHENIGIDQVLETVVFNKHEPLRMFKNGGLARSVEILPRGRASATRLLCRAARPLALGHIFDDVDLVVQCGTPMMWPGHHRAEWLAILWADVLAREDSPKAISLAAGSCYPWVDPRPPGLDRADASALARVLGGCEMVTFRDELAREIGAGAGFDGPVLPCVAMHWAHGMTSDPAAEAVIVNLMPRGGHFLWTNDLLEVDWLSQADIFIANVSEHHPVILLCHNADEFELAARWPQHQRFWPKTIEEYFEVARRGKIGMVNRMHAAVALAGIGVPAVAVGTDTRLLMVETAGQHAIYLANAYADGDKLTSLVEQLFDEFNQHRRRLLELESRAFDSHVALVNSITERICV